MILLVNDEMAHPAQELSFGVPIRAVSLVMPSAKGPGDDGNAVSGIVLLYFLIR